jgi:hypothetical protein
MPYLPLSALTKGKGLTLSPLGRKRVGEGVKRGEGRPPLVKGVGGI